MNIRDYLANCIDRILKSPYAPSKAYERAMDLAKAIETAGTHGVAEAHKYLIALSDEAEKGKYGKNNGVKKQPEPTYVAQFHELLLEMQDRIGYGAILIVSAGEEGLAFRVHFSELVHCEALMSANMSAEEIPLYKEFIITKMRDTKRLADDVDRAVGKITGE